MDGQRDTDAGQEDDRRAAGSGAVERPSSEDDRRAAGSDAVERPSSEDVRIARERTLSRLAARQHGVATRKELISLGFTADAIDGRVKLGRFRVLHRGVYLISHPAPPHAFEMAAVLACGPGAVLSHRSAAVLWGLLPRALDRPGLDVTVPGRNPGRKPGVRVHRARKLEADEVTSSKRIPITTPARTVLDLAAKASESEIERLVAEAERRRLASARRLLALLARYPTRPGAPTLRSLLERDRRPAFTRSEAERRFLALIRRADLQEPDCNVRLGSYEVDFLWRDAGLVVEVDGYAHHAARSAFERDRRRDAALVALGYTVIRVTWRQIADHPAATLVRVAQALATRA